MKISVVIPYFNRRHLILHTLKTISKTEYKDIEVIIVDDASDQENQLDDIVNNYWFPIKLIKIKPEQRWWVKDSCVCINVGTEAATGEVLVVQQPECCHIGDILLDASKRITDDMVVPYSCYTLNEQDTQLLFNNQPITYRYVCETTANTRLESAWINHPVITPVGYHYCMAVTKKTWKLLGGMDMDYSEGFAYCDMDLREKIYCSGLQMVFIHPNTLPFVVHMYHPVSYKDDSTKELMGINKLMHEKKRFKRERYYKLLESFNVGPVPKTFNVRW